MPFIHWVDADLCLKIDHMDHEHRILIDVMNRLFDANEAGASKDDLRLLIDELTSQVAQHFSHEEAFLERVHYPRIDLHKSVHRRLLTRLHENIDAFEKGDGRISKEFFGFLSIWLTSHIMGNDRDYANYVEDWKNRSPA